MGNSQSVSLFHLVNFITADKAARLNYTFLFSQNDFVKIK